MNTNTKRETIIKRIIDWFTDNENVFNDCIEELDSYNGYLNDNRYYNMEELNEFYHDTEPIEILYRAFYGKDKDCYMTDNYGNKTYDQFNPCRNYFCFDGYGNLCSTDYKDYSVYNDHYFIEELLKYRNDIYSIDNDPELSELFDELENFDDEETETEGGIKQ